MKTPGNIQVNLMRMVSKCIGLDVSLKDAATVWERYSNAMCPGWMVGGETVTA
jgi:hypothetical protein